MALFVNKKMQCRRSVAVAGILGLMAAIAYFGISGMETPAEKAVNTNVQNDALLAVLSDSLRAASESLRLLMLLQDPETSQFTHF